MHDLRRLTRLTAILVTILVALPFLVAGCGGGSGGGSGSVSSDQSATSGTVTIRLPATRSAGRAAEATAYRCTGTDGSGQVLYGPLVVSPTPDAAISGGAAIILRGVPLGVVSLLIEPLVGGAPVDALERPLALSPGSPLLVIDDGLAGFSGVASLAVTPGSAPPIAIGGTLAFVATGTYPDGSRHEVTDVVTWNASPPTLASVATNGTVTGSKGGPITVSAALDGATASVGAVVSADHTTLGVASSVNPTVYGQSVTFTATISAGTGTPTGTVTFKDGATTLGTGTLSGGQATLATTSLGVGAHSITAVFAGDAAFAGVTSAALTQTVNRDGGGAHVGSSANPSAVGQQVTFTASVTATAPGAGTPTGSVTFLDGATILASNVALDGSGQATFATSALAFGTHSITVTYGGDGQFSGSTSSAVSQVVKYATTTALASSANPSSTFDNVTFTATVAPVAPGTGVPTGTVTFMEGATTLASGVALDGAGQAAFSTLLLAAGSHSITAIYSGDATFAASTSSAVDQAVQQALFVGDGASGNVLKITLAGVVSTYVSGFGQVQGLAFDSAGSLWVIDNGDVLGRKPPLIGRVPAGGGGFSTVVTGVSSTLLGLVIDPSDNLYMASGGPDVLRMTPTGATSTFASSFTYAYGVAFDGAGNLLVTDEVPAPNGRVVQVAPNGTVNPTPVASGLNNPIGLALDSSARLYVSAMLDGTVIRVGDATPFATGLNGPQGLAFDGAGNLYVVEAFGNVVSKVTPAGVKSTLAAGLSNPHFVVVR